MNAPPGFVPDAPPGFEADKAAAPSSAKAAKATPQYDDKLNPWVGGALDVLGLTQRPGARTMKDVLVNPQGTSEHVARALGTGGALMLGGIGAGALGLPALAGEMAVGGGLGALEEKAKGGSATWGFIRDAAITGLTGKLLGRVSEWLSSPGRALAKGQRAPEEVLDAIRDRMPTGKWMKIPSLSSEPMTASDAMAALSKAKGATYQRAWAELGHEIDRLDGGKVFVTSMGEFIPRGGPTAQRLFEVASTGGGPLRRAAGAASRSDAVRGAAEALALDPTAREIGAGMAVAPLSTASNLPKLAREAAGLLTRGGAIP